MVQTTYHTKTLYAGGTERHGWRMEHARRVSDTRRERKMRAAKRHQRQRARDPTQQQNDHHNSRHTVHFITLLLLSK